MIDDSSQPRVALPAQGTLMAAMLGCTMLASGTPVVAQDTGEVIVLDTVTLKTGDDDESALVAQTVSGGSRMQTDILDTPASVSVVTAAEIERRDAQTVEEVLQYSAGVLTNMYGADDRFDYFRIRGFGAYAYRDGLALGSSFGAVREEAHAFERVEVVRGGNSTAFGISDPGGSVNYVTKTPRQGRHREVYATYGSNNRKEVGFDFGDDLTQDGTVSYRVIGKLRDADAEYDYSRDDEGFLLAGVTWRPSDATSVTLVVDHLNREGVPGSGGHPAGSDYDRETFFGVPSFNYRGTNRTTASLMIDHDFGNGLTFGSNIRFSDTASDFGYAYITGASPEGAGLFSRAFFANDSNSRILIGDARLQYDASIGGIASRTLVGVEFSDADRRSTAWFAPTTDIDPDDPVRGGGIDLDTTPPYQSRRTEETTKAVYVQQELTFADRFIANIGLRHDWIDVRQTNRLTGTKDSGDYSESTYRAGLTYKITPDLSLYGSYSQSVVPASLTVEPERGEQYELGVKYRPGGGRALLSAAVYDLTKNNITRTNPVTGRDETIGEVNVRGLDLEAKVEMMRNFDIIASYSHLESEIVENGTGGNIGNEVSFVPSDIGSVWVNYTLEGRGTRGDMTFGLGARYTSAYWFDDANTQRTDDAVIWDASYNYAVHDMTSLSVNVSNLFDEKHVAYGGFGADFYSPGRSVSATLRHSW